MDLLKYKTVEANEGSYTIASGLNLSQIISVKRQGIQYDYVGLIGLASSNRCWSFISHTRRIVFNSNFPFAADETIYIMYKVTV